MKKVKRCGTVQAPTKKELRAEADLIIARLVAKGLIKDSGRRRKGQIVWVCAFIDDKSPGTA